MGSMFGWNTGAFATVTNKQRSARRQQNLSANLQNYAAQQKARGRQTSILGGKGATIDRGVGSGVAYAGGKGGIKSVNKAGAATKKKVGGKAMLGSLVGSALGAVKGIAGSDLGKVGLAAAGIGGTALLASKVLGGKSRRRRSHKTAMKSKLDKKANAYIEVEEFGKARQVLKMKAML